MNKCQNVKIEGCWFGGVVSNQARPMYMLLPVRVPIQPVTSVSSPTLSSPFKSLSTVCLHKGTKKSTKIHLKNVKIDINYIKTCSS